MTALQNIDTQLGAHIQNLDDLANLTQDLANAAQRVADAANTVSLSAGKIRAEVQRMIEQEKTPCSDPIINSGGKL